MRVWAALPVLLGLGAMLHLPAQNAKRMLLLTGDSRGSLGPCGCTKPMTGGIKRLATAVKAYGSADGVLLANGDFTGGPGRQEVLKAQTLAETLSKLGSVVIRIDSEDDRRNPIATASIRSMLSDSLLTPEHGTVLGSLQILAGSSEDLGVTLRQASSGEQQVVVLMEGDLAEARKLAKERPGISLIHYRDDGRAGWSKVGTTLLVTPGSKLRDLVAVPLDDGVLGTPKVIPLDEHVADDQETDVIYRAYLRRVDKENLLAEVPRNGLFGGFAGTERCSSCHANAGTVWKHSKHAAALKSLEAEGHGKDPECVSCHVVGLDRTDGYRDRLTTPQLANVGCESCHGAGASHAKRPHTVRLGKVGSKACVSCHTTEQSPNFRFAEYWPQVRH